MNKDEMKKALEKLIEEGMPVNDGDYIGEDGLLYCGKCHTRKQTRLELGDGQVIEPFCMCKCEELKYKEEEENKKKKERMNRIQRYKHEGFIDSSLCEYTFAKDDSPTSKESIACRRYVKNFDKFYQSGKGLMLWGNVGTGKTFLASCIANALIDDMHPCLVTNFPRLINTLSGMYEGKQEYIDSLNRYDLLVIDDLATERDTEYVNEIVYNIIDSRYRSGKPLIVTTNLSPDALREETNINRQRIYSRINGMCFAVRVDGKDRRRDKPDGELLKLLFE